MAVRKAETETPNGSVSEARAKSTVEGTVSASQTKVASSDPSYEVLTQLISYLMSPITNQNSSKTMDVMIPSQVMEMVSTQPPSSTDQKGIEKI